MSSQSNNLKQLTAQWYKKLKDSGFEDIEQDEAHLKRWSRSFMVEQRTAYASGSKANVKEEYYRLAGQFNHEHKFECEVDRIIWEYHADGIAYRKIVIRLKNDHGIRKASTQVQNTVERLRKEMKSLYGVTNE